MLSAYKNRAYDFISRLKKSFQLTVDRSRFISETIPQKNKRMQLTDQTIVTVRIAKPEEATAIYEVERNAYQGNPPWYLQTFEEDLRYNPNALYLVLETELSLIAFAGTRVEEQGVHITNIAVHEDYRFLGCASVLLTQVEKQARYLQKEKLTLEVRMSNTKAIRLYQKFGFVIEGYKKEYYKPDNEDAIDMSYTLPPKTPSSFNSAEYSFARLTDVAVSQQLYHLFQENYEHPGHWSVQTFLEDIKQPLSAYYGVYHLEQLIGFVGVQWVLDEATITNIVIQKDFQGKGLAQRLWQMACYDLRQKGITTIFLEVREFNHRAQQLYDILGFEQYHRRRDYYTDPIEDALLYRLELEQKEGETVDGSGSTDFSN